MKRSSAVLKGALKYSLGFAVLAFVLWRGWADKPNPNPELPPIPGIGTLFSRGPDWGHLALMFGVLVPMTFLQYYRWYLLVRALGLPFSVKNAIGLGLVGTFYNTALPGSVGGDLVKAYFIAKDQPSRKPAAVATIVADRLVGLYGLLFYVAIIGGFSWLGGNARIVGNAWLEGIILTAVIIIATISLGYWFIGLFPQRLLDRVSDRLQRVPKLGHALGDLWYAGVQYRQRPFKLLTAVALTMLIQLLMIFVFHIAVQVFPIGDPNLIGTLPEHFVIAPIGYIAQVFFPAPGGVGGAEAIFGLMYQLIRGAGSDVVGQVGRLTIRLGELTFGFLGYLAYLNMKKELPPQPADDAES